jgi:SAM-dependent methyltransferase
MSDDVLAIARAEAETRGISVRWHLGSVLELPVEDSSIDLAFDRGCLHHLTPDEQRRYALEAARVLRPGGLLVLRDFNHPAHHSHALSPESIESMVAESGLTVHSILQFDAASTGHHQRALLATLVRAA